MCSTAVGMGPSAGVNACTGRGGLGRGGACIRYDGRGIVTQSTENDRADRVGRVGLYTRVDSRLLKSGRCFGPLHRILSYH
jgi:hypothetical protein